MQQRVGEQVALEVPEVAEVASVDADASRRKARGGLLLNTKVQGGRSATAAAGNKEYTSSTANRGAKGFVMMRGANVRSKSGKTSDGGGGAKQHAASNNGAGAASEAAYPYNTRKQISQPRRGPAAGASSAAHGPSGLALQSSNGKYSSHRSQKSKKMSNGGSKPKVGGHRQKPDLDSSIKSTKQSARQARTAGAKSRANTTAENISARQGPYQLGQASYSGAQRHPAQNEDSYQRGRS